MGKRLWDLAKSRFEIATILLGHRYIVPGCRLHEDRVHEDSGRTQTPWIHELSRAITRAEVPRGVAVASIARLPSSTDDSRVLGIDGRSS